jgi:hypothetical protein
MTDTLSGHLGRTVRAEDGGHSSLLRVSVSGCRRKAEKTYPGEEKITIPSTAKNIGATPGEFNPPLP